MLVNILTVSIMPASFIDLLMLNTEMPISSVVAIYQNTKAM